MNHRQTGIVLLTAMMMIVILALLVLSLMQSIYLYIRSGNQVVMNHQQLSEMEHIITKLDLTQSACLVRDKNPNQLVEWVGAHQGCKFAQYTYVVEDLGLYPCLQMASGAIPLGSHHWLVTLVKTQAPHVVLQLRMAKPAETDICQLTAIRIHQGVVSWRTIKVLLDTNTMHDKIFD